MDQTRSSSFERGSISPISVFVQIQFSLPVRSDEIFDVLDALWHLALDEVVLKEEQVMRVMEAVRISASFI